MTDETIVTSQTVEEAAAKVYGSPNEGQTKEQETVPTQEGQSKETAEADGKTDDDAKTGAPDAYEDFKVPENMELDKGMIEEFSPLAKDLDLSQEQAQKLVDLYNNKALEMAQKNQEGWEAVKTEWADAAKSDKEIGGEKFEENLGLARKALEKFGTKELSEAFDSTGTGNHPEVIRLLVRVGKAISEDGVVTGSNPKGEKRSAANIMFPDMA